MQIPDDNQLRIRDVWRAAALLTQGIPLVDAPPDVNGLCFIFDNTDDRAKIALAVLLTDKPLPIRTFRECYGRVMELIEQYRINRSNTDIKRGLRFRPKESV